MLLPSLVICRPWAVSGKEEDMKRVVEKDLYPLFCNFNERMLVKGSTQAKCIAIISCSNRPSYTRLLPPSALKGNFTSGRQRRLKGSEHTDIVHVGLSH